MSFIAKPELMSAGAASVITPGSHAIPPELWAEYAAIVLLDPEPKLHAKWIRRLEDSLGVTSAHRRALGPRQVNGSLAEVSEADRGPRAWTSTGAPWTILGVPPLLERKVAETLKDAGVRTYVPVESYKPKTDNVARSHRPWKPRTRPLLTGYIFADIQTDRHLDIARANEAVRLWCRAGRLVTVPSIAIGTLVLFEAAGAFDRTKKLSGARKGRRRSRRGAADVEARWKSGQRVKMADGPFAGFVAQVLKDRGDGAVDVLVSIFGRETQVTLDEALIAGEGA